MPTNPNPDDAAKAKQKHIKEVEPADDPVCSCEAEPRWLHFKDEKENPNTPDEWESLERSPKEEL